MSNQANRTNVTDFHNRKVPVEVAELWKQLHHEAQESHKELASMPRWLVFVSLAGALLILLVGGFGFNKYYIQPSKATQAAEATANAIALATAAHKTAEAQNLTATALASAVAATATAQYLALNKDAQATATAQAATITAQAAAVNATATAAAIEGKCHDIEQYTGLYSYTVSLPTLSPPRGHLHVHGAPPQDIYAVWTVTNTGECRWDKVEVRGPHGEDARITGLPAEGGKTINISLYFILDEATQAISITWGLSLNGFPPLEKPGLRLEVAKGKWIVVVTPTPTSTPTPTLTPTPIPKPTLTPTSSPPTAISTPRGGGGGGGAPPPTSPPSRQ